MAYMFGILEGTPKKELLRGLRVYKSAEIIRTAAAENLFDWHVKSGGFQANRHKASVFLKL